MVARLHSRGILLAAIAVALFPCGASGDVVTLQTGGTISGKVSSAGAGQLVVRTTAGSRITVERATVKGVQRGADATASNSAASGKSAGGQALSREESAWLVKVRRLVTRLEGQDPERNADARRQLRKIEDPDAIPALFRYLGPHPDDQARGLLVSILRDMPPGKGLRALIELSLVDPSAAVRLAAIEAIGKERAASAAHHYTVALRSGSPQLIQRAAVALGKLGDPNYTSVPALIDNLTFQATYRVMTRPEEISDSVTIGPTPKNHFPISGPKLGEDYGRWYLQKSPAWRGGRYGMAPPVPNGSAPSSPSGNRLSEIHRFTQVRAARIEDLPVEEYRPDVHDALRTITGKDFALDRDAWRKWLASEHPGRESAR
jgi:hypothetical protein